MDNNKELELGILVTIRNNDTVPYYNFCKLFQKKWKIYCYRFNDLTGEGLFKISASDKIPGLYRYELTGKGKFRIMDLLTERNEEIKNTLTRLKQKNHFDTGPLLNASFG